MLENEHTEKVAGGGSRGTEEITQDEAESEEYCDGLFEKGKHDWVKTGNHKEDSFLVFWTNGYDEYKCFKCGNTKWVPT